LPFGNTVISCRYSGEPLNALLLRNWVGGRTDRGLRRDHPRSGLLRARRQHADIAGELVAAPGDRADRRLALPKASKSAALTVPHSMHGAVYNTFNFQRHLISRSTLRIFRAEATAEGQGAVAAA
jgi:hypothetical protein